MYYLLFEALSLLLNPEVFESEVCEYYVNTGVLCMLHDVTWSLWITVVPLDAIT